jgi:hypothetical protein
LFAVSTSRGDGEAIEEPVEPDNTPEVMPLKGAESPMKDPFTPYDIGGPAAAWRLEDLTPDERVVAMRGLDDDQSDVQAGYADAAKAQADRAKVQAAASQLGVDGDLAEIGVVP